ncbi:SipW-dependent-type signal peptide-containing protein [Microbacterium sp. F2E]|uniref:SipW-dependent-type signal peptide-containing protein n=1 Tax=Microbacterium sp. F2E TaxID=2895284 RepID=UPI001E4E070F|nr:SipW-dependent-type signal peptide-containing protein [Microbacterium sp. F2E]MCC9053338.1 SipW-dependent-type signal peptide-containing protein [Microbacterium sp. F2E]
MPPLRPAAAPRPTPLRRIAASAFVAATVVVAALSGIGGTYALWNSEAPADAGTVTAGSAGLTAAWSGAQTDQVWSNLLPGEFAQRPVVVTNTGAAPLALTVAVAGTGAFEVRAATGACSGTALTAAAADGSALSLGVTLQPAASTTICIEVRAAATASPGLTLWFAARFDGTQVPR